MCHEIAIKTHHIKIYFSRFIISGDFEKTNDLRMERVIPDSFLEVVDSLENKLEVAIMRSDDRGFVAVNKSMLLLFKFESIEEVRDYSRKNIFANIDSFHHLRIKLHSLGCVHNERILFKRKDGTNFWGLLTSVQRHIEERVVYDEKIIDITTTVENEHKLAEKTMLLDKVTAELDRFIYSSSHDLRSPISTLAGLINLMKISPASTHNDCIDMMGKTLQKLETHIQKLVDFAKNSNEKVGCDEVNMLEIFLAVLTDLRGHANYERVSLSYEIIGKSVFFSDQQKVKTILHHVIKNSFDFIDLKKTNHFLKINFHLLPDRCELEIVDNGIGIEKEHLPLVCQMFYRATAQSHGSGLGLFIAKEAALKIRGHLDVVAEYGVGCSVRIIIPNAMRLR